MDIPLLAVFLGGPFPSHDTEVQASSSLRGFQLESWAHKSKREHWEGMLGTYPSWPGSNTLLLLLTFH